MAIAATVDRTKHDVFRWRYELSIPAKIALSLGVAVMVGLLAQVRVVLPFTPVPITGQTFGVLLAAVLMGRLWGGVSLGIYAVLGFAGVPWFSGWAGGFGATGGYIIGFILAALFVGHFTDTYIRSRSFLSMLGLMLVANFILIHIPGLIWLGVWVNVIKGSPANLAALLAMGMTPFIIGDVIKAVAAAAIARGVTPKSAYGREVDSGKWANWRLP